MGRLSEERQEAKVTEQFYIELLVEPKYLSEEVQEQTGWSGAVSVKGPFPPSLHKDLAAALDLIVHGKPLPNPEPTEVPLGGEPEPEEPVVVIPDAGAELTAVDRKYADAEAERLVREARTNGVRIDGRPGWFVQNAIADAIMAARASGRNDRSGS